MDETVGDCFNFAESSFTEIEGGWRFKRVNEFVKLANEERERENLLVFKLKSSNLIMFVYLYKHYQNFC